MHILLQDLGLSFVQDDVAIAIETGSMALVKLVLDSPGIEPLAVEAGNEWPPIVYAVQCKKTSITLLAYLSQNVNDPDDLDYALIQAASAGRLDFIEYLLSRGADPYDGANTDLSAYSEALIGGHVHVLRYLFELKNNTIDEELWRGAIETAAELLPFKNVEPAKAMQFMFDVNDRYMHYDISDIFSPWGRDHVLQFAEEHNLDTLRRILQQMDVGE